MYDKFLSEGINNQYLSVEEGISPMDPNSEDYQEMKFLFNTLVNDMAQKQSSSEQKTYGIEYSFSLKNQYISLNFEKREMQEITSYGWYAPEDQDEKKFLESLYKLRLKGQDKIGFDINVSPLTSNEELTFVFICKFIIGECYILFQGDQLEQTKEELAEKYDTIVKISENKSKKYEILKPENMELLYLVRLKDPDFEPKTIQCTGVNCKSNEQGVDSIQIQEKKICFCLLSDSYLCKSCHQEYHQANILFGDFGPENCEQKPFINNYQGECENKLIHPNTKETIEFFCKECNRGICSFCRFNSNEKHKDLHLVTNLFNSSSLNDKNSSFKEIKESFNQKTRELSKRISECQKLNQAAAKKLLEMILIGFNKMFRETNDSFTHEGEMLLGICYQLNYLRDCLVNFNKQYEERENLLKSTKLKQELFWTKRVHFENLLFLINVKDSIKISYKVEEKNFEKYITKYKKMFSHPISIFLMDEQEESKKSKAEKQDTKITANFLLEEGQINTKNKGMKKK